MTDKQFKQNIDDWIKFFNVEISKIKELQDLFQQNHDEMGYLYSLVYEIKDDIEDLKQEINALKLIQILSIKQMQKN